MNKNNGAGGGALILPRAAHGAFRSGEGAALGGSFGAGRGTGPRTRSAETPGNAAARGRVHVSDLCELQETCRGMSVCTYVRVCVRMHDAKGTSVHLQPDRPLKTMGAGGRARAMRSPVKGLLQEQGRPGELLWMLACDTAMTRECVRRSKALAHPPPGQGAGHSCPIAPWPDPGDLKPIAFEAQVCISGETTRLQICGEKAGSCAEQRSRRRSPLALRDGKERSQKLTPIPSPHLAPSVEK